MYPTSGNDFEHLANTGVKAPGTMLPRRGAKLLVRGEDGEGRPGPSWSPYKHLPCAPLPYFSAIL